MVLHGNILISLEVYLMKLIKLIFNMFKAKNKVNLFQAYIKAHDYISVANDIERKYKFKCQLTTEV